MQISEFQVLMPKLIRGSHNAIEVGESNPGKTDMLKLAVLEAWSLFPASLESVVKEVIGGEIIIGEHSVFRL